MGRPCVQSHVQPLSRCGHRLHEVVLDWPYTQTPEAFWSLWSSASQQNPWGPS